MRSRKVDCHKPEAAEFQQLKLRRPLLHLILGISESVAYCCGTGEVFRSCSF